MAMWPKWEERFKHCGAKRIFLSKSKKGGSDSGKEITRAKCLMFFHLNESAEEDDVK